MSWYINAAMRMVEEKFKSISRDKMDILREIWNKVDKMPVGVALCFLYQVHSRLSVESTEKINVPHINELLFISCVTAEKIMTDSKVDFFDFLTQFKAQYEYLFKNLPSPTFEENKILFLLNTKTSEMVFRFEKKSRTL